MADLEQRLLKLRHILARFDFNIQRASAEFAPQLGIGEEPARFFARDPRPFGDAAKGVIHCPVQAREEWDDLLPAARLVTSQCALGRADRHIDQEIAVNWRSAEVEVELSLNRDRLEK